MCLPCQPNPAAAASGFSITGAVSTNTFTARAKAGGNELRQVLQQAFYHVMIIAMPGVDGDVAAVGQARGGQRVSGGRVAQS